MKTRVPTLEDAFELNLPNLVRSAKALSTSTLVLDGGDVRMVVVLAQRGLMALLGGRAWSVDIVHVQCLKGRSRPLLKCPRAHEGNFQSLYYREGVLACRHCHRLRYRSNLAASATERARLARVKLLAEMGAEPGQLVPERQPFKWRKRHLRLSMRVAALSGVHYCDVRGWLDLKRWSVKGAKGPRIDK